jgi:DNA-binding transcriptional MocR family regulator
VLVEQPTYDRPLKILHELGAEIVPVAMDDGGLDPDALEAVLTNGEKPGFLYTIPTFQNPSGRTLSTERRRRIVELARAHDLLVLEDDPYGLVRFEGEREPSLLELEAGDHVIYTSSFSKTVAPGIRVGYFIVPPELRAELEAASVSTYITPGLVGQATVHEFVQGGRFESNVARVCDLLRARRDAMLEALDRELADSGATWSRPQGGYFVWLDVPGVDSAELLERATASGVTFVCGTDFGGGPSTARLAYSFVSPDEIREGVARLAALAPAATPH